MGGPIGSSTAGAARGACAAASGSGAGTGFLLKKEKRPTSTLSCPSKKTHPWKERMRLLKSYRYLARV